MRMRSKENMLRQYCRTNRVLIYWTVVNALLYQTVVHPIAIFVITGEIPPPTNVSVFR